MKTQKFKYVIIGNSIAAVAAIEGIRKTDAKGSIAVVGDENHFVYGRPLISYYLLGATDAERMKYRPADFYEKNGATTLLGVRAENIDTAKKERRPFGREGRWAMINCSWRRVRVPSIPRWRASNRSKSTSIS